MAAHRRSRRTVPSPARHGWLGAIAAISFGVSALGCGAEVPGGATATAAVRLARGVHPLARSERDLGRLDPARRLGNLSVVFKLSPEALHDRAALIAAQLDAGSPEYHAWLTPETYAARFGAAPADIARTAAWLTGEGLEVVSTSRLGSRVRFAGRVADVEAAFQTEMRRYQVGDETHYAMAGAPAIPAELSDVVLAVYNTHDFYARPLVRLAKRGPDYDEPGVGEGLAPSDWATLYDVTPLYKTGITGTPIDGSGVTIAIVGLSPIQQSDIDAFRSTFGLPPSTVTTTLVPGSGAERSGCQGCALEATLDVEWSGGIAPKAEVNYVYNGTDDPDPDDAAFYVVEENLAPLISESFAGCEYGLTPSDADVIEVYASAANLLGITYVAGSGDAGAAACYVEGPQPPIAGMYVNVPASYPGVTAVGGTQFPQSSLSWDAGGHVLGYSAEETTWNEASDPNSPQGLAATGGGISAVYTRPSYQSGVPTCTPVGTPPTALPNGRQLPDVALTAAANLTPYFIECVLNFSSGDCGTGSDPEIVPIGGTSAATPSFAGVLALLNQATGGRLGNVNPMLYTLQQAAPLGFHDITTGSNEISCTAGTDPGCATDDLYGFPATTGYDCATGLGSIDAYALVSSWATLTPTSAAIQANPTATMEGASITLTATVAVDGTGTSPLGGTVTFAFQSYNAGVPDLSWPLGAVTIAGGTVTGGMATFSTPVPPGLVAPGGESVDVVAMYGGDAHYLASTSAKVTVQIQGVDLAITPAAATVAAGAKQTFSATGGVTPVRWYVDSDTTCDAQQNCSSVGETSGTLTAGPQAGTVIIAAVDADGAEALATVTVTGGTGGSTGAGGSGDTGGFVGTGGAGGGTGGSTVEPHDAGTDGPDGGEPTESSGGCTCGIAPSNPSPVGMLGAAALGLAVLRRRRRR
jgi:MYXO-CTERM domain-containing protein